MIARGRLENLPERRFHLVQTLNLSESLERQHRRATARRFGNRRSHDWHADHVGHHPRPDWRVQDAAARGDDLSVPWRLGLQPLINRRETITYRFERRSQNLYRVRAQI